MAKQKFRVGQKIFNGKNLLVFSAWIELEKKERAEIISDVVFIELTEGYVAEKKLVMKVVANDIRAMTYAIKELIANGETKYEKYTDPKLAGTDGAKNKLSFGKTEDGTFYFNLSSGGTKVRFPFDTYHIRAFVDSLTLIADETEKALYWHMRSRQKKNF